MANVELNALSPEVRPGYLTGDRTDAVAYPHYPQFDISADHSGIDFYRYLRILRTRWKLILGTMLSAVSMAVVLTLLMTPVYRATTSLQIDRQTMDVTKVGELDAANSEMNSQEFYQTQYEVLASRSMAERVVSSLGLLNDASFNNNSQSLFSSLFAFVAGNNDPAATGEDDQAAKLRRTVDRLLKELTVAPVRGSKIVRVSVDNPRPAIAQRIANGYAEAFIADNLDRRYGANSYARKFLEDRLQQLRLKLEDSEKLLVKYAQEQGIVKLDDNKNLSSAEVQATSIKLSDVRGDRIKKELLWKQAQATEGLGLKEILDNPAIQENMKQKAQLESEYQEKLSTFKPAFPAMIELRNRIKELDHQSQADATAIKLSIQASYLAAKDEEDRLQQLLEQGKTDYAEHNNRNIQYNILQREVDTNRTLYEGLLQRYKEIGIAGGVGTNNVSIVDQAYLPVYSRTPNIPLNISLAILLGLLLGCAAALGLDYLDDSFKVPEDLERELGIIALGSIPKLGPNDGLESELGNKRSALSEAYRSLRIGLQFSTSDGLPKNLLVTSSQPSEGKTTTSIQLARSFTDIGLRVLLIDADLRNASIHSQLKISNEFGLSNYLTGSMKPEDVVCVTGNDKLVVMTSGPLPPNPAELLSGPRLPALIELAASSFDVVVIDGPPIMGLADAPQLASVMRATLLVVAANETRRQTVKNALRRISMTKANLIGAVLNKFDVKQTTYGYGYGDGNYNYYTYGNDKISLPGSGGA
jgi:polysaccharide biosynthesis transport protein